MKEEKDAGAPRFGKKEVEAYFDAQYPGWRKDPEVKAKVRAACRVFAKNARKSQNGESMLKQH